VKIINKMGLMLLAVMLSGCQQSSKVVPNHAKDYLTSTIIAPLRVPEGINQPREIDTYPLPYEIPMLGSLQPVPLEPPGFGKLN
jgi:uncharacterized lipoprotein